MTMQVVLDQDGRIKMSSNDTSLVGGVQIELPEDFDFERQGDYRVLQDEIVYDPLPEPAPMQDPMQELRKQLAEQENALCELAEMIAGGEK